MIADFGLSRVMEEEKLQLLTEICGTPGVRDFQFCTGSFVLKYPTFSVHGARNIQEMSVIWAVLSLHILTESYAAGHGKPVDIWAMGVITYFLLCGESHLFLSLSCSVYMRMHTGYTPFDRDTQEQEMQAIIAGNYAFEPGVYVCMSRVPRLTTTLCSGVLVKRFRGGQELRHRLSYHRPQESPNGQRGFEPQVAGVRATALRRRYHGRA